MKIKKATATCLLLCVCALLCACSRTAYKNEISCNDLGAAAMSRLDDGLEYARFEAAQLEYYFDGTDEYDDVYTAYSTDTGNINEIGIFHAKSSDDAEDLYEECVAYLDELRTDSRAFIASYAPNELPKLDGARVRRLGNYVVYTVLPTDSTEEIFAELESILEK